jgi:hypothetical protein
MAIRHSANSSTGILAGNPSVVRSLQLEGGAKQAGTRLTPPGIGGCANNSGRNAWGTAQEEKKMANLQGTKTHKNFKEAFAGDSPANRRYLYFAKVADVEGQPEIAGLFRDIAEGETGHAHGHWII